jgi:hypothetical protein
MSEPSDPPTDAPERLWAHQYTDAQGPSWVVDEYDSSVIETTEYIRADLVRAAALAGTAPADWKVVRALDRVERFCRERTVWDHIHADVEVLRAALAVAAPAAPAPEERESIIREAMQDEIKRLANETAKLVRMFRTEEVEWGARGDHQNWTPAEAAIELIRELRRGAAPGRAPAPEPDIRNYVEVAVDRAASALEGLSKAQQREALALIEQWVAQDRRVSFTVSGGAPAARPAEPPTRQELYDAFIGGLRWEPAPDAAAGVPLLTDAHREALAECLEAAEDRREIRSSRDLGLAQEALWLLQRRAAASEPAG